jgi:hypothetical protein
LFDIKEDSFKIIPLDQVDCPNNEFDANQELNSESLFLQMSLDDPSFDENFPL